MVRVAVLVVAGVLNVQSLVLERLVGLFQFPQASSGYVYCVEVEVDGVAACEVGDEAERGIRSVQSGTVEFGNDVGTSAVARDNHQRS